MKFKRILLSLLFIVFSFIGVNAVNINDSINLKTEIAKQEYIDFAEALIQNVEKSTNESVINSVNNFIKIETNKIKGESYFLLNESSKLNKELKTSNISKTENVVMKRYTTKDFSIEFYDNGIFSVEVYPSQISLLASGTVFGSATKEYYSAAGVNIFTISVSSTFSYNGTKASYYSGFDAYYTRGFLSIWQVSNWVSGKEAVGYSYSAYAKGNFHFGLEVNGVGIVIQDFYIKHTVTCTKDGVISRSYVQN